MRNIRNYLRNLTVNRSYYVSADNDEPLRYAPRTLLVSRTMKGLRGRTYKIEGKSWYDNNWFVSL